MTSRVQVADDGVCAVFLDTGDSQQRPVRDAWFSVGLSDKAAFLAVLSNSALHLSSMRKGGLPADETAAALTFQTEAVSIINQRLAQSAAKNEIMIGASDGTIGAASGLICNAVSTRLQTGPLLGGSGLTSVSRTSEAPGRTGRLILEGCRNSCSSAEGSRSSTRKKP